MVILFLLTQQLDMIYLADISQPADSYSSSPSVDMNCYVTHVTLIKSLPPLRIKYGNQSEYKNISFL